MRYRDLYADGYQIMWVPAQRQWVIQNRETAVVVAMGKSVRLAMVAFDTLHRGGAPISTEAKKI